MRLRTEGVLANWHSAYVSDCFNQSCSALNAWTVEVNNTSMRPYVGKTKTFSDTVSPGWFWRRAKGEVFFNPMQMTELEITFSGSGGRANQISQLNCSGTLYNVERRWSDSHYFWALTGGGNYGLRADGTLNMPTDSLTSADQAEAILEAATKARAGVKSGNAGGWETLAQTRKTLDLLRNPFSSLTKMTNSFMSKSSRSKGSRGGPGALGGGVLQIPADEWLKYRYGVLPLINDVQAVLNELGRTYKRQRHSSRASVTLESNASRTFSTTTTGWGGTHQETRTSVTVVRAVSLDEYVSSMAIELGLDLSQLPKTAWELVPFSFVADWFVNVGDFLNAMTPRLNVNHLGGCVTIDDLTTTSVTSSAWTPPVGHTIAASPSGTYVEIRRTKRRDVPLPGAALQVKADFRFDKLTRIGDAAALIGKQLNRLSVR